MNIRKLWLPALAAALALAPMPAPADGSGTLNDEALSLEYTSPPYFVPNVTGETGAAGGSAICEQGTPICDVFDLTIAVSDELRKAHPDAFVELAYTWGAQSDYDIFVYDSDGTQVASATNFVGAGGDTVFLYLETLTNGVYHIEAIPYLPLGDAFTMNATVAGLAEEKGGVLGVGAINLAILTLFAITLGLRRKRKEHCR
jgi:hypothetical protein